MDKTLILGGFLMLGISMYADKSKNILMDNDGTIQTTSGTIFRLFQGEMFAIDSINSLAIFTDRAFVNNVSGYYSTRYGTKNQYDVEPRISIRKDSDSIYVRIKKINGFRECLLINQNRNKCFAKLTEAQLGSYHSYSLTDIQCDSNTVLRIAPIGFYSFIVHWDNIKRITEHIDTTRYTTYELTITKTSNKDTIRTYKSSRIEPINIIERSDEPHSFSLLYMILGICLSLIFGIGIVFVWRKNIVQKRQAIFEGEDMINYKEPDKGICEDHTRMAKYERMLESKNKEIRNILTKIEQFKCMLEKKEKEIHNEMAERDYLVKELEMTKKEGEKKLQVVKEELKKSENRLYSIENQLRKTEYDKQRLEEELLEYKDKRQ